MSEGLFALPSPSDITSCKRCLLTIEYWDSHWGWAQLATSNKKLCPEDSYSFKDSLLTRVVPLKSQTMYIISQWTIHKSIEYYMRVPSSRSRSIHHLFVYFLPSRLNWWMLFSTIKIKDRRTISVVTVKETLGHLPSFKRHKYYKPWTFNLAEMHYFNWLL